MFRAELRMPKILSLSQELSPKALRGPFQTYGFFLSISLYIKFPAHSNYLLISTKIILT